jgi:hypothetical protein
LEDYIVESRVEVVSGERREKREEKKEEGWG